ncbi:MAG: chromosome segregation protein SMC [Candidatus Margulisbacteria bacterium]|jgi:chromosome segregation protein|nr:chromosome segregation protein SMC [Candidatus Margulisiibacteriota bacterium]
MHLRKLELCGFKTFPDRTSLEFTDARGITAIVGPNGCGKSNIIDAFRWVMGEQSLKILRGSLQEEVIFSGTEDRKPVSLAEVFLTIDNADRALPVDYAEVEVGRRYYRTGESEYLINKEIVRLRDVQELLMDTGLGKGSYSIIGQGQVTTLLHSKPEDRRELFAEAAGIHKYKTRKLLAQRKLQTAEQNLFRLSDIRAEIHQQLGPLEEQARAAQEYQVLKKDLAGLEVGLFRVKLGRIEDFKRELEQKIDAYQQVVSAADLSAQELADKKQAVRNKIVELDQQLSASDAALQEARRQKAESANKLDVAKERIGNHQQRLQAVEQEIIQLDKNKETLLSRQNEAGLELKAIERAVLELEDRLSRKNEETKNIFDRWQTVRREIEELENALAGFNNQLENKRSKLLGLESGEKVVSGDLKRLQDALAAGEREKAALGKHTGELNARKIYVEARIEELLAKRDGLFRQRAAKETERKTGIEERGGVKEKFDQQSSRLKLLEEMQQTREGFQKGVRSVFQARQADTAGFAGISGVVADILSVPKKYEAAVEAALENNLQAIVAENSATVMQVIQYLKEHSLGRATFAAGELAAQTTPIEPPAGVCALNVVSCADRYREFVAGLLGTVCIVDDLKQALDLLAGLRGYGLTAAVTLAGEVVTARGLITGGSAGQDTVSLLGRQREIIELRQDIEKYSGELKRLDAGLKAIENLFSDIDKELRGCAEELKNLEIEQGTIANDLARYSIEREKLDRGIDASARELEHQRGEVERIALEKQHLLDELAALNRQKAEKEQAIADKEVALKQTDSEKEKVNELLTEIKISSTNALGTKRQIQLKLESYRDGIQQASEQLVAKAAEKENLKTSLAETEQLMLFSRNALPALERNIERTLAEIAAAGQERARYFNDLESCDRLEKERNAADREVRAKLAEEEIKMARVEAEYQEMLRRITDEYNLTVEDVLKSEAAVADYDRTQDEVEKLKRRIRRMEPVNLLAIEEYEAQKERLAFIEAQCADLEKSRADLLQIIRELDRAAIDAFRETFQLVNEHFKNIFVDLFKGGSAELHILDEANVLDSGIEILARVPGTKRAQSMTLLSGGQKALTAIALLFALLSARPGPFCILDEIDAALDDLNIGRVTDLLRQYAERTQIIIITHRQPSMSVADAMFGLTMEQKGVSKIVSVKLPGAKEKALVGA